MAIFCIISKSFYINTLSSQKKIILKKSFNTYYSFKKIDTFTKTKTFVTFNL